MGGPPAPLLLLELHVSKPALLLCCVTVAALLLRSVLADDKPDFVAPGKLTYGVAATFSPFEFQKDGKLAGFDIEMGEAVAAKMGLVAAPLNTEFKGLIPALQGKRVDIVDSAMYINPQRAEQVEFVPYMTLGNEIVVKKGNPLGIKSRADLCGHRIAVTLGGIEETYARQDLEGCKTAGKPEPTIMTLPSAQDSALSLRQGRAEALFDSEAGAIELVETVPDAYEIAGEPFESNTHIGLAVRKGDVAMKAAVEAGLKAVVADGTYARMMVKYRLPPSGSLF